MFSFFRKKNDVLKDLSISLVDEIGKKYPPDFDKRGQRRISEKRLTKVLEACFTKAQGYKSEKELGVYGVAKLVNEFRWELEDRGYDKNFIKVAAEGLTVFLTRK